VKKIRLGSDPLSWIQDTRRDKPLSQQASKTAKQQRDRKKATFYIEPDLIKGLKLLGIQREKNLSDLVNEAIIGLLEKYTSKPASQHIGKGEK